MTLWVRFFILKMVSMVTRYRTGFKNRIVWKLVQDLFFSGFHIILCLNPLFRFESKEGDREFYADDSTK